jgi:recombination protein RecA
MVADYRLTKDQWQLLLGSALGDGSLRKTGTHSAAFRVGHGQAQEDYVRWKRWMLEPFSSKLGPVGRGVGFDTLAFPALADLHGELYMEGGSRTATAAVLDRLDARGIALWYGDDGSFAGHYERWGTGKAVLYNTTLKGKDRERVTALFERLGVGRPTDSGRGFRFDAEQTSRLHELIAPYLHPSVDYKLHPTLRGRFTWQPDLSDAHLNGTRLAARRHIRAVPARIKKIYVKPPTRSMRRFDLEVEGSHTYLVDGVVVHNSPETTPGGRALKFYCSVRLDIRRIGSVKDGADVVGNRTRVKVVKNKVAPPFRTAEFDIVYGEGISSMGELVDLAVEHDVINKSGSWYSYGDTKIGQGRESAKTWLRENPELHDEIKHLVKVVLGMVAPSEEASPAAVAGEARNGIVPENA